jgi:hypothetical protein
MVLPSTPPQQLNILKNYARTLIFFSLVEYYELVKLTFTISIRRENKYLSALSTCINKLMSL